VNATELCRWASMESAIIAGNFDQSRAVELAKRLSTGLAAGEIEIRPVEKPVLKDGEPFTGKPMSARFAGKCAVCEQPIAAGATIVYSAEQRRAAHIGCGQPEARGHR